MSFWSTDLLLTPIITINGRRKRFMTTKLVSGGGYLYEFVVWSIILTASTREVLPSPSAFSVLYALWCL